MRSLRHLFERNREWAASLRAQDSRFFEELSKQQSPEYLWIGCSDSRVPANQIVGLLPGELFVHRNIANVVVHTDLNCLSVIQFAVDLLEVEHVIVVGHTGCSGVRAALDDRRIGIADIWLRHVQDVRNRHRDWLDAMPDAALRHAALCELNVLEQARNVCQTTVVQDAWARGQQVVVHGWVYGLHNGLLEDLRITVSKPQDIEPAYERALEALKQRFAPASTAEAAAD